jgi:hypothetical protein
MKETKVYIVVAFLIGGALGFVGGICATKVGRGFVETLFESEHQANVSQKKNLVGNGFRLSYPGNWKVDTEDKNYDKDHCFCIESSGANSIMFAIFDTQMDPDAEVQSQVEEMQRKLMPNSTKTTFARWGAYEGKGVCLKGKMLGMMTGSMRIFCHAGPNRTFMVSEQVADEDLPAVQPGLNLVESTFKMKE